MGNSTGSLQLTSLQKAFCRVLSAGDMNTEQKRKSIATKQLVFVDYTEYVDISTHYT